MLIPLASSWLCPEGHIGDSPISCDCGNSNVTSLARILDREDCAERLVSGFLLNPWPVPEHVLDRLLDGAHATIAKAKGQP